VGTLGELILFPRSAAGLLRRRAFPGRDGPALSSLPAVVGFIRRLILPAGIGAVCKSFHPDAQAGRQLDDTFPVRLPAALFVIPAVQTGIPAACARPSWVLPALLPNFRNVSANVIRGKQEE
jgi:hypothetical protein